MPKLWSGTIEAHRRNVRGAILNTAADLVAERGLRAVTMSQIARQTGIGRATLYKYFSGVEPILFAWHQQQIMGHLAYLADVRDHTDGVGARLAAVLEAYALISHESRGRHGTELEALFHGDKQVSQAQHAVGNLLRGLLTEAALAGAIRDDVSPTELATYCVHALAAASAMPSKAAVRRLVTVTLAGLHANGERAEESPHPL